MVRGIGISKVVSELIDKISRALENSSTEIVEFTTKNCVRVGLIDFYCNRFGYDTEQSTRIVDNKDNSTYVIRAKKR